MGTDVLAWASSSTVLSPPRATSAALWVMVVPYTYASSAEPLVGRLPHRMVLAMVP